MASPQKEDGYTQIPNELLEQLAKIKLNSCEGRTIFALIRKTYGWHKETDRISISQFEKLTGLNRSSQCRALKSLVDRNVFIKDMTNYITAYGIQKDYTKWKGSLSVGTSVSRETRVVSEVGPKLVSKEVHTKESKETIQKKEKSSLRNKIIRKYKELKGYTSQPDWDRDHYDRHVKPAKKLAQIAPSDWEQLMTWVSKTVNYCDWNINTVIKKQPDYMASKNKKLQGAAGRMA